MTWDTGLSGIHKDIAASRNTPLHVLAGPGTGKTFALMRRIARLLEQGVPHEKILAVTFTRTAAKDLREQLLQLGSEGADKVTATTLHSFCFGALVAEAVFQATGRRARPLLSFEIDHLVADLNSQFGGKRRVRRLIEAYEAAWARLQADDPGFPRSPEDQAFQTVLEDWLRYHRAMLIGELVPLTLRFLQQNPTIPILQPRDAVLVDEYQDLNKADQALIDVLATGGSLTVIGDDNQSIYSFRHANPEGIRAFAQEHQGTQEMVIQECRRCPPNLVAMSNSLIANDPLTTRQTPLAPSPGVSDADVYIVQHTSLADEADALAAFIQKYLSDHPEIPPGQVLVLSPRRIFGNAVRDALIARRLNSMSFYFEDALDSDDAAEGFCLLTLAVDPTDRAAYRAWLGLRHATGNSKAYERVRQAAMTAVAEPFSIVEQVSGGQMNIPYTAGLVGRHNLLKQRLAAIQSLKGLDLVDSLWPAGAEEVTTVRLAAQTLAMTFEDPKELLEELRTTITQPELPDSDSSIIRVMSLHKSKGLTARLVVVVGVVDGAIPTLNDSLAPAARDAAFAEQRRLFYVAITRASQTLVISSSTALPLHTAMRAGIAFTGRFMRGGESFARTVASPFIAELGASAPTPISGTTWRAQGGF
jgi:DNA helicase II / ATP-dependent DNA helicase PcrA